MLIDYEQLAARCIRGQDSETYVLRLWPGAGHGDPWPGTRGPEWVGDVLM